MEIKWEELAEISKEYSVRGKMVRDATAAAIEYCSREDAEYGACGEPDYCCHFCFEGWLQAYAPLGVTITLTCDLLA